MPAKHWETQYTPTKVTTSSAVVSTAANFGGLMLTHDGTNDPTWALYDNTSAQAADKKFGGTWGDNQPKGFLIGNNVKFETGIYLEISNLGSGYFTVLHNTNKVTR